MVGQCGAVGAVRSVLSGWCGEGRDGAVGRSVGAVLRTSSRSQRSHAIPRVGMCLGFLQHRTRTKRTQKNESAHTVATRSHRPQHGRPPEMAGRWGINSTLEPTRMRRTPKSRCTTSRSRRPKRWAGDHGRRGRRRPCPYPPVAAWTTTQHGVLRTNEAMMEEGKEVATPAQKAQDWGTDRSVDNGHNPRTGK